MTPVLAGVGRDPPKIDLELLDLKMSDVTFGDKTCPVNTRNEL